MKSPKSCLFIEYRERQKRKIFKSFTKASLRQSGVSIYSRKLEEESLRYIFYQSHHTQSGSWLEEIIIVITYTVVLSIRDAGDNASFSSLECASSLIRWFGVFCLFFFYLFQRVNHWSEEFSVDFFVPSQCPAIDFCPLVVNRNCTGEPSRGLPVTLSKFQLPKCSSNKSSSFFDSISIFFVRSLSCCNNLRCIYFVVIMS